MAKATGTSGTGKRPFEDREAAVQASAAGLEERRRRGTLRREDPEGYMRLILREESGRLIDLLLDAAYGRKTFLGAVYTKCPECEHEFQVPVPSLQPDKRFAAIAKALEFAAGKPATQKPEVPTPPQPPKPGLNIE